MNELAYTISQKRINEMTQEEMKYLVQFEKFISNKVWLVLLKAEIK